MLICCFYVRDQRRNTFCRSSRCRGVTLVEILIAIVILSFGLLGVAALQGRGLQSSHDAYLYSQAAALAYDIGERMRVNRARAVLGGYNTAFGVSPVAQNCTTATCNSTTMALYDLYDWKEMSVKARLPSADASIAYVAATQTATIRLRWRGRGPGTCDAVGNAGTGYYCTTLTVKP